MVEPLWNPWERQVLRERIMAALSNVECSETGDKVWANGGSVLRCFFVLPIWHFLKDSVKLLQNLANCLPIKAPLSAARTASVEDEVDLTQTLILSAGTVTWYRFCAFGGEFNLNDVYYNDSGWSSAQISLKPPERGA